MEPISIDISKGKKSENNIANDDIPNPENMTDMLWIISEMNKIIEYLKQDENIEKRKKNENLFIYDLDEKFSEFSTKFPVLFKLLLSGNKIDFDILFNLLERQNKIKNKGGDFEEESIDLIKMLDNKYKISEKFEKKKKN